MVWFFIHKACLIHYQLELILKGSKVILFTALVLLEMAPELKVPFLEVILHRVKFYFKYFCYFVLWWFVLLKSCLLRIEVIVAMECWLMRTIEWVLVLQSIDLLFLYNIFKVIVLVMSRMEITKLWCLVTINYFSLKKWFRLLGMDWILSMGCIPHHLLPHR